MADERKEEIRVVNARPRSLANKVGGIFFSEDASTVARTIWKDYIVPSFQNAAINALEIWFFGSPRGGRRRLYYRDDDRYTQYDRYYDSRDSRYDSGRRVANVNPNGNFKYLDYDYRTLDEVMEVIEYMQDKVREYHFASVSQLNSKIGITGDFTDQNWGWKDCRDFNWKRSGGMYSLDFAPPIPLDR